MNSYLKFWGTRGSCPVSGAPYKIFGGNTLCLELRYHKEHLIFDAGTGIRPLGQQLIKTGPKELHLFLSHMHWDHIIGLPFFDPLYRSDFHITIWAPKTNGKNGSDLLKVLFHEEFFPVSFDQIQASLDFQTIEANHSHSLGKLEINFHPTEHPGKTLSFQVKTPHQKIGYVTDNEIKSIASQKSLIAFYKNSDLFIHEAQYTKQEYLQKTDWGHSCFEKSVSLIKEICPKRWLVTHHDPKHSDQDLKALCKAAKKQLKTTQCNVPIRWLRDGAQIALKNER